LRGGEVERLSGTAVASSRAGFAGMLIALDAAEVLGAAIEPARQ
jgi:hypothetical protein